MESYNIKSTDAKKNGFLNLHFANKKCNSSPHEFYSKEDEGQAIKDLVSTLEIQRHHYMETPESYPGYHKIKNTWIELIVSQRMVVPDPVSSNALDKSWVSYFRKSLDEILFEDLKNSIMELKNNFQTLKRKASVLSEFNEVESSVEFKDSKTLNSNQCKRSKFIPSLDNSDNQHSSLHLECKLGETRSFYLSLLELVRLLGSLPNKMEKFIDPIQKLNQKLMQCKDDGKELFECLSVSDFNLLKSVQCKLKSMLTYPDSSLVQKAIYLEVLNKLDNVLKCIKIVQRVPDNQSTLMRYGLNLTKIAKATTEMNCAATIEFINTVVSYQGIEEFSRKQMLDVYLEVKDLQVAMIQEARKDFSTESSFPAKYNINISPLDVELMPLNSINLPTLCSESASMSPNYKKSEKILKISNDNIECKNSLNMLSNDSIFKDSNGSSIKLSTESEEEIKNVYTLSESTPNCLKNNTKPSIHEIYKEVDSYLAEQIIENFGRKPSRSSGNKMNLSESPVNNFKPRRSFGDKMKSSRSSYNIKPSCIVDHKILTSLSDDHKAVNQGSSQFPSLKKKPAPKPLFSQRSINKGKICSLSSSVFSDDASSEDADSEKPRKSILNSKKSFLFKKPVEFYLEGVPSKEISDRIILLYRKLWNMATIELFNLYKTYHTLHKLVKLLLDDHLSHLDKIKPEIVQSMRWIIKKNS